MPSNQREPTKDSHLESALIRNGTRYGQLSPIRTCSDLGHPENSYTEDINDNTSGNWYSFVNVNGMGKSRSAGVGWLRSPGCVRLLILMVVIDSGCGQSPDDQTLGECVEYVALLIYIMFCFCIQMSPIVIFFGMV